MFPFNTKKQTRNKYQSPISFFLTFIPSLDTNYWCSIECSLKQMHNFILPKDQSRTKFTTFFNVFYVKTEYSDIPVGENHSWDVLQLCMNNFLLLFLSVILSCTVERSCLELLNKLNLRFTIRWDKPTQTRSTNPFLFFILRNFWINFCTFCPIAFELF